MFMHVCFYYVLRAGSWAGCQYTASEDKGCTGEVDAAIRFVFI